MPGQQNCEKFAEVVGACYQRIFRGALSVSGDPHLAEEIVQETFVLAFRKFDTFSGNSSPCTWLYRIMLNKYRDHYRRKKLLRRLGLEPPTRVLRFGTEALRFEEASHVPTDDRGKSWAPH
jgi:RNA polymerase sigma factor (sigma-70 family)